ncbi:hypothetical protein CDCA_CDCA07G2234 [Cyanidium caldarium]|uniref:Photolyase/cryptochrome alpha/beta domain-containing protein n=1 Tax=Cyanidium caldarium TaxID=2771 RepID=A0AAV9IVP2_CYACA|nr:hypothetical protein CDCA_CDCA07G2234 [Cyanidium caldarium]
MFQRRPSLVWYRGHDLRVEDMPALLAAVQRGGPVVPVLVWAPEEDGVWAVGWAVRWWLRHSLHVLDTELRRLGCRTGLVVRRATGGHSVEGVLAQLAREVNAEAIFWNRVYDPVVLRRDEDMRRRLQRDLHLTVESFKAELLVEPWEVTAAAAEAEAQTACPRGMQRFHDFMARWMVMPPPPQPLPAPNRVEPVEEALQARMTSTMALDELLRPIATDRWCDQHDDDEGFECPDDSATSANAEEMQRAWQPGLVHVHERIQRFLEDVFPFFGDPRHRQRPTGGTSRLSPYLRFGELSPRRLYHAVRQFVLRAEPSESIERSARAFLQHLCLREYGYHLLFHHPSVVDTAAVPEFDRSPCADDAPHRQLHAWARGQTGYPLVDAAMRELAATGWLHAALRFLVASFLVKYLQLPWQSGSRYMFKALVDGELSSNAIGWQWAAGCTWDTFPLVCLVNPILLGARLDPEGTYVRRWCPELRKVPTPYIHSVWKAPPSVLSESEVELGRTYPLPLVDSQTARRRARDALRTLRQCFGGTRSRGSPLDATAAAPPGAEELMREWPIDEVYNLFDPKQEDVYDAIELAAEAVPTPSPSRTPLEPAGSAAGDIAAADGDNDSLSGDQLGLLPKLWSLSQDEPAPPYYDYGMLGSDRSLPEVALSGAGSLDEEGGFRDGLRRVESFTALVPQPNMHVAGAAPLPPPFARAALPPLIKGAASPSSVGTSVPPRELGPRMSPLYGEYLPAPPPLANSLAMPPMVLAGAAAVPAAAPAPSAAASSSMPPSACTGAAATPHRPSPPLFFGTSTPPSHALPRESPEAARPRFAVHDSEAGAPALRAPTRPAAVGGTRPMPTPLTTSSSRHGSSSTPGAATSTITTDRSPTSRSGRASGVAALHANAPPSRKRPLPNGSHESIDRSVAAPPFMEPQGVAPDASSTSSSSSPPLQMRTATRTRNTRARRHRAASAASSTASSARAKRDASESSSGNDHDIAKTTVGNTRNAALVPALVPVRPPATLRDRVAALERTRSGTDEFALFADYLATQYVITENVRRTEHATDFVRLRNLKDDFHDYCSGLGPAKCALRNRLKIYRLKVFFSGVLNLEVTGEWDRHAHGGVRGPYVYGLAKRNP